jgi:hypothetical protein
LLLSLGSYKKIQQQLKASLSNLIAETTLQPGYIGGNILNLLVQMQTDLSGYDFSYLIINQAYLQDANLYDVNFAYCHFYNSVFAHSFGGVLAIVVILPERDGWHLTLLIRRKHCSVVGVKKSNRLLLIMII